MWLASLGYDKGFGEQQQNVTLLDQASYEQESIVHVGSLTVKPTLTLF